jgi:putative redox protein
MEAAQAALACCSGVDVVSILGKMRKTLSTLRIEVLATRCDEAPRVFTALALVYHIDGPDLDRESVERAVELSQDKYCSVAAMLRPAVELSHRIILNGAAIPG